MTAAPATGLPTAREGPGQIRTASPLGKMGSRYFGSCRKLPAVLAFEAPWQRRSYCVPAGILMWTSEPGAARKLPASDLSRNCGCCGLCRARGLRRVWDIVPPAARGEAGAVQVLPLPCTAAPDCQGTGPGFCDVGTSMIALTAHVKTVRVSRSSEGKNRSSF